MVVNFKPTEFIQDTFRWVFLRQMNAGDRNFFFLAGDSEVDRFQ